MRKGLVGFAFLLLVSALAVQLFPSGAGQHYTAIIQNAADAAGNLVGGGSGGGSSASASRSVAVAAAGPLVAHARFTANRGVDVDLTPGLPGVILSGEGCLEITQGDVTVESGCTPNPGLSIVDPVTLIGIIDFVVPTNLGTCAVLIAELGSGTPGFTPPGLTLGNPIPLPGLTVGASRDATVLAGIVQCTSGNGGTMPSGTGQISSSVSTGSYNTPSGPPVVGLPGRSASGGGFIVINPGVEQNHKGTFGFSFTGPIPQGSLSYHDHLAEVKVQSVAVTSFVVSVDGSSATATGIARVNGVAGYSYEVTVTDGAPDTLTIHVTGPDLDYSASGNLGGGSITVNGLLL